MCPSTRHRMTSSKFWEYEVKLTRISSASHDPLRHQIFSASTLCRSKHNFRADITPVKSPHTELRTKATCVLNWRVPLPPPLFSVLAPPIPPLPSWLSRLSFALSPSSLIGAQLWSDHPYRRRCRLGDVTRRKARCVRANPGRLLQ